MNLNFLPDPDFLEPCNLQGVLSGGSRNLSRIRLQYPYEWDFLKDGRHQARLAHNGILFASGVVKDLERALAMHAALVQLRQLLQEREDEEERSEEA